ncbi:MAG: hypothetical protein ACFFB3_05045, partial [Candidatus Hodarchaeota archaeon]
MLWFLKRSLQRRRDLLWSRIVVESTLFYCFLFSAVFLQFYWPMAALNMLFVWGPLFLLGLTIYDGLSQINLYFRLEKIQQNNLPDFTIAFFPGNAWLRINPYSPLAKRFDLSRSGLIALADIP